MWNYRILLLLMVLFSRYMNAYEFSFFNKTQYPIAIAIKFANSEQEPLYKLYIKPNTMKSFVPGSIDIPDIKWSFCLKDIYYIKEPTMAQRAHNFGKVSTAWKQVPIKWINTKLETTPQLPEHVKNIKKKKKNLISKNKKKSLDRSLCRDRHFEIIEDENSNITIVGSLIE